MKNFLKSSFFLIFIGISAISFSQTSDSLPQKLSQSIKLDGVIKTKLEVSTESGVSRFNVRNSRIGLRGDFGKYLSYRAQIELSNEGVFSPLDLHGILKPMKNLSIQFGQTSIPFENGYVITPAEMMFANRAFVGKYFTPGSRDIGVVALYKFRVANLPFEAQAGTFNGGKINNPTWTDKPSYAFRLIAGSMDGLRVSAKAYKYDSDVIDHFLCGMDVHYANKRLRLETEVMNRHSYTADEDLFGAYAQAAYTMDIALAKMFHNLTPAIRWDAMGYDVWNEGFDVNRITAGVDFGLSFLPYESLLRLNYEHYFLRGDSIFPDFEDRDPHVSDHKITVELVVRF